jgi:hypothetical protein
LGIIGLGNVTGRCPSPALLIMAFQNLVTNVIRHALSHSRSPDCCIAKVIVSSSMNRRNSIG